MNIETILILNNVVLVVAAIALTVCSILWYKAEKRAAKYKKLYYDTLNDKTNKN